MRCVVRNIALVALVTFCGSQASGQDILAETLAAHTSARQSINTCTCRFESIKQRLGRLSTTLNMSCEFFRSADVFRVRLKDRSSFQDLVVKDAVVWSMAQGRNSDGSTQMNAGAKPAEKYPNLMCDPWSEGLLVVPLPNTVSFVAAEELIKDAAKVRRVGRRMDGDREVVAVELTYQSEPKPSGNTWDVTILFDPQVNYLVRKFVMVCDRTKQGQKIRNEHSVVEFKEAGPGVFFPVRSASLIHVDDQLIQTGTASVSNLRVNQPLPADTFRLAYQRGVTMYDGVKGTKYKVDENGKPISEPVPDPPGNLSPTAAAESSTPPLTPRLETQVEPSSSTWWVLPCSFGVLALGGVLMYRRSRRV